jgi:biopolymer transport protein ExbD
MSRVILYFTVATIAFIVGVAANWSLNMLGGFAVDDFDYDAPVDVKISTILPDERLMVLSAHRCGQLIVSVTADGALDLNSMPKGFVNDTRALTASLRTIFERREELHVYGDLDSLELSSRVPEYRQIEKTVYIKAPRSTSYGEVADLIAAVKEAGGHPVGLIADLPSPNP